MTEIMIRPSWRDRLDAVVGRRRESWVVVAAIAAFVAIGMVLWARGTPAEIAPPSTGPDVSGDQVQAAASTTAVIVHVAGLVRHPGVYELPAGSRVADAIDVAGGPRPRADLGGLNLAQVLLDGAKIDVLARAEGRGPVVASSPSPGAPAPVSLNAADATAIESIPGIGPVKAAAILEHRERAGGFGAIEELLEVPGIGPATLEAIRPYVTL